MRSKLGLSDDRMLFPYNAPVIFILDNILDNQQFTKVNGIRLGSVAMVEKWVTEYGQYQSLMVDTVSNTDAERFTLFQAIDDIRFWTLLNETIIFPLVVSEAFYGAMSACRDRINSTSVLDVSLRELLEASSAVTIMFQGLVAAHMLEGPGFNVYAAGNRHGMNAYAMSVGIKTREHRAKLMHVHDIWFRTLYRTYGANGRVRALLKREPTNAALIELNKTVVTLMRRPIADSY
jgi:hypothetical protein